MSGLLDLLSSMPSAQERYQQVSALLDQGGPSMGTGFGSSGGNIEGMAHDYFMQHGYSPADWQKVQSIIGRESSWDPHAVNDESGAAGIAQNINGFSANYSRNDPMEQIRWLMNYLNNHHYDGYGTGIDAAYAHKNATGWY